MHIGSARPVTHKSDNARLKRNSLPTFLNFLLTKKQPTMMEFPHMPTVRAKTVIPMYGIAWDGRLSRKDRNGSSFAETIASVELFDAMVLVMFQDMQPPCL